MSNLLILASALVVCGLGIVWKQSTAKACPVHNRAAGMIATGLAVASFVSAALLAWFALIWQ